jgi:hypothetical protein
MKEEQKMPFAEDRPNGRRDEDAPPREPGERREVERLLDSLVERNRETLDELAKQ